MDDSSNNEIITLNKSTGFYERLGLWYFNRLSGRDVKGGAAPVADRTDKELVSGVRRVTLMSSLIAFIIGGISAGGSVYTELLLKQEPFFVQYGWVAGVTVVLTAIEFSVLFWVSIRAVFAIARISGHNVMKDDNSLIESFIPNLLARAALEIPDPVTKLMGIDPMARVSKKRLLLMGILYKLKIAASNVLAKLFLRRVAGKSILRVSVSYISVIITGMWNAIVCFKVVREARLRLFGNHIAKHLVDNVITDEINRRLSGDAKIGCMMAVGNAVVNAQRFHPNMVILLMRMSEEFGVTRAEGLDDWGAFLEILSRVSTEEKYFILDLLCISAAFDGKVSRIEKRILHQAFGEYTEIYFKRIYRLARLMTTGRLNEAIAECNLDFEPG